MSKLFLLMLTFPAISVMTSVAQMQAAEHGRIGYFVLTLAVIMHFSKKIQW